MQMGLTEKKRTFDILRKKILVTLSKGQKTTNQISVDSGINWRTVENHLTYLMGKSLVSEIFSSKYVRIFELTEEGKKYLKNIFSENITIHDGKIEIKTNGKILES